MNHAAHDERRPVEGAALTEALAGSFESIVVRCTRCDHHLTARKSVKLKIGPVCRLLQVSA